MKYLFIYGKERAIINQFQLDRISKRKILNVFGMEYNAGIIIRLTSNAIMNDLYENEGKAIYIYMNKIKD